MQEIASSRSFLGRSHAERIERATIFKNKVFCKHLLQAMVKVTEAEDLRTSWLVETFRTTESCSSFVPPTPAAQAEPHVPLVPTHNPESLGRISEVLANHETIVVDDRMFYFAFGIDPQNLHPNPVLQERGRILEGPLKEDHMTRLRWSRTLAGLEVVMVFKQQRVES